MGKQKQLLNQEVTFLGASPNLTTATKSKKKKHEKTSEDLPVQTENKTKKKKRHNGTMKETETAEVTDAVKIKGKKRKSLEVNARNSELNDSQTEKKVEKPKQRSILGNNILDTERDQNTSLNSSSLSSKEKKRKRAPSVSDDTQDDDLSTFLESPLKKSKVKEGNDEQLLLLEYALKQTPHEKKAYAVGLSNLDFEEIASHFPEKSADHCKSELKTLIEKTLKMKCLNQVLRETIEELPERKKRTNKFANFVRLNREAIDQAIADGRGTNKFAVASLLWGELSREEQFTYLSTQSKLDGVLGATPFDCYFDGLKRKGKKLLPKDARTKWSTLKAAKKMKYIGQSAKLKMELMSKREQKLAQEDDGEEEEMDIPPLHKLKGPTKAEVDEYLEYFEFPKSPEKMPALMYYKDQLMKSGETNPKSDLFEAMKQFRLLDVKTQETVKAKHMKIMKKYAAELEKWKEQQNEVTLFIYNEKFKERTKSNTGTARSRVKISDLIDSLKKIQMPVSGLKFPGEPIVPPITPLQIYAREMEKINGIKLDTATTSANFKALNKEQLVMYKGKAAKIREVFVTGLKSFVNVMHEEERKLFLGTRRIRYIRILKEDIFEEEYPSHLYPVYVKSTNEQKNVLENKVSKVKDLDLENEDDDEDENSDSEEESSANERLNPSPKKITPYSQNATRLTPVKLSTKPVTPSSTKPSKLSTKSGKGPVNPTNEQKKGFENKVSKVRDIDLEKEDENSDSEEESSANEILNPSPKKTPKKITKYSQKATMLSPVKLSTKPVMPSSTKPSKLSTKSGKEPVKPSSQPGLQRSPEQKAKQVQQVQLSSDSEDDVDDALESWMTSAVRTKEDDIETDSEVSCLE